MSSKKEVWLGLAPAEVEPEEEEVEENDPDPYVMQLGGHPIWLYPGLRTHTDLRCANALCRRPLQLLAQIHAPLEGFCQERVLYVMCCSQNKCQYYVAYRATLPPAPPPPTTTTTTAFDTAGADDWGDGEEEEKAPEPPRPQTPPPLPTLPPPHHDRSLPSFRCTWLEPVLEEVAYRGYQRKAEALEQRLRLGPPALTPQDDPDSINPEYESSGDPDRAQRRYFKHMEKCGRQVIRWALGGQPLWLRSEAVPLNVPPCGHCGRRRVFECQILSTAVYLLSSRTEEAEETQPLTFGTVGLYTCANPFCGEGDWVEDYVHVQEGV